MFRHVQNMLKAPRKFLEGSQNSLKGFGYVQIIFGNPAKKAHIFDIKT